MKVADVIRAIELLAPPSLAEDWDNVGLLVGDLAADVRKVVMCVDLTEPVLAEAVREKAQMVVAHHPLIFKAVSRVTATETPVTFEAIRRGVAVYCAHTNLDAAPGGTSDVLADVLQLTGRRPIQPFARRDQCKVVVFVPPDQASRVADAAFAAGAGQIGDYRECGFFCHGIGSFRGGEGTRPAIGKPGRHEATEELRLEVMCARAKAPAVREAIRAAHSYEEPAIDIYALEDFPPGCGTGRIGRLKRPTTVASLIGRLKKALGLHEVMLAAPGGGKAGDGKGMLVTTVACCTGSGRSVVRQAVAQGATLFVTGELGHHDALDAVARGLTVACLGHGHSERLAMHRLGQRVAEALPGLAVVNSQRDRDPYAMA